MKKLLLGIFAFFVGFISFSSAGTVSEYLDSISKTGSAVFSGLNINSLFTITDGGIRYNGTYCINFTPLPGMANRRLYLSFSAYSNRTGNNQYLLYADQTDKWICLYGNKSYFVAVPYDSSFRGQTIEYKYFYLDDFLSLDFLTGCASSDISVFYDYGHSSTSVVCNGDNSIFIDGMANVSNQTTFTPFFNISYVDEDNQNLIESYNKDMLYLDNGKFKKTYTGDNQWILTVQNQGGSTPDIIITGGSLPVVVTGESDNVFSNFGDNALSVLYGNIPGFITGAVILFLIFFIIRLFIPKNRR